MTAGRYQEIDTLFGDLLQLPREDRAASLAHSCRGDENLRNTLEALLAAYESEDGFLDAPAFLLLDHDPSAQQRTDLSGVVIGGYRILQPLGAGALAEVWLAKDERLQRQVALKILRAKFVRDSNQVLRFEQEARAASKLSHPNIVTIHEIGESEGIHFIAQELIDGVTLRKRLAHGLMPIDLLLEIAMQVVAALSAAHKSGIIHRDIKPENLMIRTDGLVKVLDFGIARVVEQDPTRENGWLDGQDNLTTPGLILGTVKYMSPEQARGLALDPRSDIFSFGTVLYEMATGKAPFSGPTSADTLAAVLADNPAPISASRPDVTPQLEQLILQCLEKDRDQRFSSTEDLAAALRALALRTEARATITPPSRANLPIGRLRAPSLKWLLGGLSTLSAIAVLLTFTWRAAHPGTALPFDSMEITRLALPGPITDAAIAPNAKSVAYLLQGIEGPSVWIRQLAPTQDKRIAALAPGNYQDLIYSPDSAYIYYVQTTNLAGTLYRIPSAGGRAEQVLGDVTGRISFTPDGRRLAFIRLDMTRWEESLIVANSDGTEERKLTTRRRPYYYSRYGVAWSRDGNSIFCLAGKEPFYTANAYHIVKVGLSSGRETPVPGRSWAQVGSLISSVDGRMLIVAASEHSAEDLQLWRTSYPDGHVTRITRDLSNYAKLSLSANSQALLAVRRETTEDLWTMPVRDSDGAKQISSGEISGLNSAAWARDDEIIYSASTGQSLNLWKMNAVGQNGKQLTRAAADQTEVAATPDGRYILYHADGKVWRMNADGSQPRQLTRGNLDVHPVASPDSRWVVYASFQGWSPGIGGRPMIWRVPIDGGEPIQVTKDINSLPAVSPDGKLIACAYFLFDKPQSTPKIAVYPFEGGPATKVFDRPAGSDDKVYWSPDGKSLEYIVTQSDVSNIWRQPLQGEEPAPITRFRADRLFFLSPSPNGKRLVLGRGKELTELVLITEAH